MGKNHKSAARKVATASSASTASLATPAPLPPAMMASPIPYSSPPYIPIPPSTTPTVSDPSPLPEPTPPALTASPTSYKPVTDAVSIEKLTKFARESPPDAVLGIVWQYAFEEGREIGRTEGASFVDGVPVNDVLKTGVEKGIMIGRDREKLAWGAAGHSETCITVPRPPRDLQHVGIQVEPSTTTGSIQTTPTSVSTLNPTLHPDHPIPPAPPMHQLTAERETEIRNDAFKTCIAILGKKIEAVLTAKYEEKVKTYNDYIENAEALSEQRANEAFAKGHAEGEIHERGLWESECERAHAAGVSTVFKAAVDPLTEPPLPLSDPITLLPPPTCTIATQTVPIDDISMPLTSNVSIQTMPASDREPKLVPDTSINCFLSPPLPEPFNWGNDAASLPILPISPIPRDLSSLRSDTHSPFQTLQRRNRRQSRGFRATRSHSYHYLTRKPPWNTPYHSLPFTHLNSFHCSPPFVRPPPAPHFSVLDWDQDPWLFDLSRALTALGWTRA